MRPPAGAWGLVVVAVRTTPAVVDVEVLAAASGVWNRVDAWRSVGARWPYEIALSVLVRMR
jgi:hypothetical protein